MMISALRLAAVLLSLGFPVAQAAEPPRPLPQVLTAVVTEHAFSERIEALGTARANESVTVTSKAAEQVSRLHFTDGALVRKGAILAELTSAEESAQLAEARAALDDAEKQYDRILPLVRNGSLSKARLDAQTAIRDGARARVEALEARLADLLIKAPFSGVVGLRRISPGTLVQPGDPIVTLDDVDTIKLDFTVPETQIAALAPGQTVTARSVAFRDKTFTGQIATLDSRVDPVTRAVTVRALIDNPERLLRPGMLLVVAVTGESRTALRIPEEALVPEGQQQYVYTLDGNDTAVRRPVVIGAREPGFVEVRDGLKAGEKVITEGTIKVRPGQKVDVQKIKPQPPQGI